MENKSFLSKFLLLLIGIVLLAIVIFFFMNKDTLSSDLDNVELITSMNVNTYEEDLYIYKLENNKIFTSEYFYNNYYLSNNTVDFDEFDVNNNTKYYLKTLSNTANDLDNIKISYDPITQDEFLFLLNNYTLLKVYLWFNEDDSCKNIMLYSSNNIELEVEHLN